MLMCVSECVFVFHFNLSSKVWLTVWYFDWVGGGEGSPIFFSMYKKKFG